LDRSASAVGLMPDFKIRENDSLAEIAEVAVTIRIKPQISGANVRIDVPMDIGKTHDQPVRIDSAAASEKEEGDTILRGGASIPDRGCRLGPELADVGNTSCSSIYELNPLKLVHDVETSSDAWSLGPAERLRPSDAAPHTSGEQGPAVVRSGDKVGQRKVGYGIGPTDHVLKMEELLCPGFTAEIAETCLS